MNSNFLRSKKTYHLIIFFILILCSVGTFAAGGTAPGQASQNTQPYLFNLSDAITSLTAQNMLDSISKQIPNLMRMVTAIGYVMGMYFIFVGIMKLKQYGEARSMMSQEHSLKAPIIFLTVGALLIYLPTSVHIGMSTFWTNPTPYGYQVSQGDQWTDFLNMCFLIVQFVGTIAFIRGLVIMTHLGGHGQPGTFARGMTHIIGGIFCINIYQFIQVILITLGMQT